MVALMCRQKTMEAKLQQFLKHAKKRPYTSAPFIRHSGPPFSTRTSLGTFVLRRRRSNSLKRISNIKIFCENIHGVAVSTTSKAEKAPPPPPAGSRLLAVLALPLQTPAKCTPSVQLSTNPGTTSVWFTRVSRTCRTEKGRRPVLVDARQSFRVLRQLHQEKLVNPDEQFSWTRQSSLSTVLLRSQTLTRRVQTAQWESLSNDNPSRPAHSKPTCPSKHNQVFRLSLAV